MKRRLAFLLFAVAVSFVADTFASGETVFVDLDRIYRNYYKTKLAYTQLNAQAEGIKKDGAALLETFETLKATYEQLRAESLDDALSEEIRSNKRNEAEETLIDLQEKGREIRETEQRANKQLQKQKSGMDKRILEQIQDAIKTEAQTKGYLCVTNVKNVGATALQAVMTVPYYDADAEITDQILARLNKGHSDTDDKAAEAVADDEKAEEKK